MIHQELCPAVHLHVLPMEKFKTNQISVSFMMPLSEKTASYASLLSMVLKTGCRQYPDVISLGRALDLLYGARLNVLLRKKGDCHIMTFLLEFLDSTFAADKELTQKALSLLDQIIFDPLLMDGMFLADVVAREKKNLIDLIDGRINDKRMYALRRCGELAAQGQPFEAYECGNSRIVSDIGAQDLFEFYRNYLQNASVEIYAFGRMDAQMIADLLSSRFSSARQAQEITMKSICDDDKGTMQEIYPVEQAKLSIAFAFDGTIDPVVQRLFVVLYGGSASSLLFLNVREKLSLCYYCSATVEPHKNMMTVYSGVMPEKIEAAKAEILAQLRCVQEGKFTKEDLDAAKKAYVNSLRSMFDSVVQIEDYAITQGLLAQPMDVDAVIEKIESISIADIQAVATRVKPVLVYLLKGDDKNEAV